MRVVQTRNKGLVFGILLSALVVGVMLTMGQVPLAVSQPVTIPVGSISGADPDGCSQPGMGNGSRDCGALERPNDYDSYASQHLGEDRHGQNGHQRQGDWGVG